MMEYDPYDASSVGKRWYEDYFFDIVSNYINEQMANSGNPATKFFFYEDGDDVVMYDNINNCCVLQCTRIGNVSSFIFCNAVKSKFATVDYFKNFKRDVYHTAYIVQIPPVSSFDVVVSYNNKVIDFIKFIDPKTGNSAVDMGMQIRRQLDKKPEYLVVDSSGEPVRDNNKLQELKLSLENILKNDLNQNSPIYGIQHPLFTAYMTILVQESLLKKTHDHDIKSSISFEIPSILDFSDSSIGNLLAEKSSDNTMCALDFEGGSGRHFVTYLNDGSNAKFFDSSGALSLEKKQLLEDVFPQEKGTCGYWTAFFCAEAIKYDSIQEIKNNFDEILLKTAAKVSEFIDQKPAILFEEPASVVDRNFLYKKYRYNNDNPPQTKTVFILNDSDPNMKSQCVNLDAIRTMLNNKYKQPTVSKIHSIPSEFFS